MAIQFKGFAPSALNTVAELNRIDCEMTEILHYLSTEERMEPQDIVDNTGRLHELAKARAALAKVILWFSLPQPKH